MKKFYLFAAALLVAGAANADSMNFYMGDTEIANGETVSFTEMSDYPDIRGHYVTFNPKMTLMTDFDGMVNIVADCTSGHNIQMCAGGACEFAKTITKNNVEVKSGVKLPLLFEFMDVVETLEGLEIVTNLSAVKSSDSGVATSCVVVFRYEEGSGIASISPDNVLSFNNGHIAYSVSAPAALSIYSVSGSRVVNATVSGNGNLDTTLAPGIYVYNMAGRTGKFIVR